MLCLIASGLLTLAPFANLDAPDPATTIEFAFWNVENLFDTEDDPANPGDDEFLPDREWTPDRYQRKREHLAEVISAVSPHVIGFAEVENRAVLEQLFATPPLANAGYQIAHLDSPDKRGIDVALAFRAPFTLVGKPDLHELAMDPPTRGILEVKLEAHGQALTVFVNHWPSRGGGEEAAKHRGRSGELLRKCALAISAKEREAGREADILMLGDFNDDPFDPSVRTDLGAIRSRNAVVNRRNQESFYNPSWAFLGNPDVGTLYYNREWVWNVFDQAIVSKGMLDDAGFTYIDGSLEAYGPDKLRDQYRRPLRFRKTGKTWQEGYSDHLLIHGRLRLAAPNQ